MIKSKRQNIKTKIELKDDTNNTTHAGTQNTRTRTDRDQASTYVHTQAGAFVRTTYAHSAHKSKDQKIKIMTK